MKNVKKIENLIKTIGGNFIELNKVHENNEEQGKVLLYRVIFYSNGRLEFNLTKKEYKELSEWLTNNGYDKGLEIGDFSTLYRKVNEDYYDKNAFQKVLAGQPIDIR